MPSSERRKREPSKYQLPVETNQLHKLVRYKILGLMKTLELTPRKLAAHLGVGLPTLKRILDEGVLPDPWLAQRIVKFGWENISFKDSPLIKVKAQYKVDKAGWPLLKFRIPEELYVRLSSMAQNQGYTIELFVRLAIERMLDNEPTIVSVKEAIKDVQKAFYEQVFKGNPYLWDICESNPNDARRVHESTKQRRAEDVQINQDPRPIQQLAHLPIEDGPAEPIEVAAGEGRRLTKL